VYAASFLDTEHEKAIKEDYLEWLYINEGILLQHIPDGNHTERSNVFKTAIIQNATMYSREQSIPHATIYSRQQSYRMLQCIPDNNHTGCCSIL